jgi:Ras-specific guanine nucleotide-releasing factor 1
MDVKPWEFLNQRWTKPNKQQRTPGLVALVKHINKISLWVATEVLKESELSERAKKISYFIEVASFSKAFNNYNAVVEIISGLCNNAVTRLRSTWDAVSANHRRTFDDLYNFVFEARTFKNLRHLPVPSGTPIVPYVGVYMSDLVRLDLEQRLPLATDTFIHFSKYHLVAQVPFPSLLACLVNTSYLLSYSLGTFNLMLFYSFIRIDY